MSDTVGRVVFGGHQGRGGAAPDTPPSGGSAVSRPSQPALQIVGSFEIAALRLQPGDVLVVKTDRPVSADAAERIRKHLKSILPQGVSTLVINPDIQLSVLSRSEIEAKVA